MRHGERLSGERDCGQAAAVILLAAQAGPAIAEEAVLLGGGVAAGAFDRGKAEPAAMRGADDAPLPVGEQHRRAIGGEDTERNARDPRHHAVSARVVLAPPRPLDGNHCRAMHLMTADQAFGREIQPGGGQRAVARDILDLVARPEAAIQRREEAVADPALPGKEGVADRRLAVERLERDHAGFIDTAGGELCSKPAGAGRPGDVSASTLNKVPLSAGSIKPWSPASRAAHRCALAPADKVARRASAPSVLRNRPCGTGPCATAPRASAAAAKVAKSTWALRSALPGSSSKSTGR